MSAVKHFCSLSHLFVPKPPKLEACFLNPELLEESISGGNLLTENLVTDAGIDRFEGAELESPAPSPLTRIPKELSSRPE
jgi:hypothetical protein